MNDLTLIIPAKNEKESLPNVLNELKKYNLKIEQYQSFEEQINTDYLDW